MRGTVVSVIPEGLRKAYRLLKLRLLTGEDTGFCTACFGGGYPTSVPDGQLKNKFEQKIVLH